ncbi:MAG: hypothetical protein QM647_09355 [Asticcacaulis sp.]|uniref:hypothetical protein n=1 Tax=Asticcacaulis sp. TaxID=1872648 RepID=UPI0039E22D9F
MRLKAFTGVIISALCLAGGAHAAGFTAGAARAEIAIPASTFPIDGFTGQHDPLFARVLLMDDGHTRAAIVVVDQTSIFDGNITAMKAIVTDIAHVDAANIMICASHGFSAPHVFPPDHTPPEMRDKTAALKQAIEAAVRTAATGATQTLQPARTGFGEGISRVGVNRDVPTPFGWWLGGNDAGYSDPTLGVLRIDGADGQPLAVVMNYGVQSSVMDFSVDSHGNRQVSADLAGVATQSLEDHYRGATSFFLIGAAADQAPYLQANRHVVQADGTAIRQDIRDAGFDLLALQGERLGQDALRTSETIQAQDTPTIRIERRTVQVITQTGVTVGPPPKGPVKTVDLKASDPVDVPVILMRVGDTAIVGVREELSASTGTWIRQNSPFAHTLVVTMADGAAKYMPAADAYDRLTYEARSSHYARGAAETLSSAIVNMLQGLQDAP